MVMIASRFCGPPDSANGGYACGLVASQIEGDAEITLRAPPPLDVPLELSRRDDASVVLQRDGLLLADGKPTRFELELPRAPTLSEAIDARKRYPGVTFSRCFVCGEQRSDDGGLMILSGPLKDRPIVAAPWTPTADLGDMRGVVDPIFVWSALDCPSWFAHAAFTPVDDIVPALLGRLSGHLEREARVGETYVSVGWSLKKEGRRIHSASALFDQDGVALAWAKATWIELKNG